MHPAPKHRPLDVILRTTPVVALMALAVAVWPDPEQELLLELAPVDLPAVAAGHEGMHHMQQPEPVRTLFGVTGRLTGYSAELIDENGDAVPREVLHHVKLRTPDRRDLFSPLMARIASAGSETHRVQVPMPVSYHFAAEDSLLLSAMLHNPTGRAWKGVRVRLRLRYRTDRSPVGAIEVRPFFLHATTPGEPSDFDLPPGRTVRSVEVRPGAAVRLLGIGGHAHRFATALRFEDANTGEVLWDAGLTIGEDGEVERISRRTFLARGGIPLDPSHRYRVTVQYDNPLPDTLYGRGMGTVAGIVRLARGATWPDVARASEVYRADQRDLH